MIDFIRAGVTILAGVLVIVGTAAESRDATTGQLTRWGRVVIAVTSISMVFSMLLLWLEGRDQQKKELIARRQFELSVAKHELTLSRLADLVVREERAALDAKQSLGEMRTIRGAVNATLESTNSVHRQTVALQRQSTLAANRSLREMQTLQRELAAMSDVARQLQERSSLSLRTIEMVMDGVGRLRTPFDVAAIEYEITYSCEGPEFETWFERLREIAPKHHSSGRVGDEFTGETWEFVKGIAVNVSGPFSSWASVEPGSNYSERFAYAAIGCTQADLFFYVQKGRNADLAFRLDHCNPRFVDDLPRTAHRQISQRQQSQTSGALLVDLLRKTVVKRVVVIGPQAVMNTGRISTFVDLHNGAATADLYRSSSNEVSRLEWIRIYPDVAKAAYYEIQAPNVAAGTPWTWHALDVELNPANFSLRIADRKIAILDRLFETPPPPR